MLILILLVGLSTQQCSIGCQKCSAADQCLLCDIINNYYLNGNTCALSTQTNCRVLALSGNCVSCNSGYYLDGTTKRCLAVESAKLVPNCLFYDGAQACVACNSGRYLNAGACTASTVAVANCNFYSAEAKCAECSAGFIFKDTLDTCAKIPDNLNCLLYTHVNCTQCSSGFVYNRNVIGNTLFSANQGYDLFVRLINRSTLWGKLQACQARTSLNCDQQNLFNECVSCQSGYFLRDKQCIAFPVEPIFGCSVYTSENVCSACVEFMFPLTFSSCVNNTVIANCIAYKNDQATNQCKECSRNYYLSANACVLRVNSLAIVDCKTPTVTADTCAECVSGAILTGDSLACLPNVANCKTYAASTLNTLYLLCTGCEDGWYLNVVGNSVLCVKGSVANCKTYDQVVTGTSTNKCVVCNNEFYVANSLCVAHQKVANCNLYSQSVANRCDTCTVGLHPFHMTTVCVSTALINNCLTYSTDGLTCTRCVSGFYPVGNTCANIPSSFTNCEQFDGFKCTQCASGFNVDTKHYLGTCYKVNFDYLFDEAKAYCFEYATLATNQISTFNQYSSSTPAAGNNFYPINCKSCATGTVPYLPNFNEAVCVKEADLAFYSRLTGARDPNCLRFGLSYGNNELVCMQCKSTHYLNNYHVKGHLGTAHNSIWNTNGISCSLASTAGLAPTTGSTVSDTSMLIVDDLLGFVNVIVPASTSTGYITNAAAPLKGCTRAVRVHFAANPAALADGMYNRDFVCVSATGSSATGALTAGNIKYSLVVNNDATLAASVGTLYADTKRAAASGYGHLTPANTAGAIAATPVPLNIDTPTTIRFDFNHGYTTVESGPFPSVFNYKGILHEAEAQDVSALIAVTALTDRIGNFDNCEILYKQATPTAAPVSHAYLKTVVAPDTFQANNIFYNYINHDTAQTHLFCMRCAFGYTLQWVLPTVPAIAANRPFPSCSTTVDTTNCDTAAVYGGLPPILNTLLSCHKCRTAGSFPHIRIETNYAGGLPAATSRFIGWDVMGAYTDATTLSAAGKLASGCAAIVAADTIHTTALATTVPYSAFPNCVAFAHVHPIQTDPSTRVVTAAAQATGVGPSSLTSRVCLACKANTWPTYLLANDATAFTGTDGLPGFGITACVASINCDSSVTTQFNGCGKCRTDQESNATPTYYGFIDALLADCAVTNTQNCFLLKNYNGALDGTAPVFKCGVCKAGFFMNADLVCESIKIPNMESATTMFSTPVISSLVFQSKKSGPSWRTANFAANGAGNFRFSYYVKVHFLLSQSGNPYGVRACKAGWVQAPSHFNSQGVCVYSPYVVKQAFGTTKFIANCIRYQHGDDHSKTFIYFYPGVHLETALTSAYLCDMCAATFVLGNDYKSCNAQGATPNCYRFKATIADGCETCLPTFLNINAKCVTASTIANCKTLAQTVEYLNTDTDLKCVTCNDGYYLSNGNKECKLGLVFNCAVYGAAGTGEDCTECKTGFGFLTTNSNGKYCYPIPADSNCAQWQNSAHSSGLNYHTFSCARCSSSSTANFGARSWDWLPNFTAPWQCLAFTLIDNCVAYSQNNTIVKDNSFRCSQCKDTHYLNKLNRECTLRVNNPVHCTAVPLDVDECTTCRSGYYRTANKLNCVINPPGIAGCLVYSHERNCTLCKPDFYLNYENRCIPALTLVANCRVYASNNNCTACLDGFFLTNPTTCSTPVASNCLEVLNLNACKTCPAGNGLSTSNGVTSCISNSILNCAVATTVSPFTCTKCNAGWFPSNGVCASVTATIAGCIEYDSATTCKTCQKAGILSVSRTSCDIAKYVGLVDDNCEANVLTASPSCAQCALGSYFQGDACVVCPNNGLSFGCLSCDPLAPANCLLCSSGFYMTKSGVCIRNTNLPAGPGTPTVPSPPSTSSVKKVVALTLGLGALYLERL